MQREANRRKENEMRRGLALVVLIVAILTGIAIGVGAYHAGYDHGLEASGRVTQVVREVGPGGFFPFGLFLFPLFFIFFLFFLLRVVFWGRHRWGGPSRWGPDHGEHGGWKGHSRFE